MASEMEAAFDPPDESALSRRAKRAISRQDFMTHSFDEIQKNPYHPDRNPQGILNLGTAMNCLMEEELGRRLRRGDALAVRPEHQHYFLTSTPELQHALAAFLSRNLRPLKPVNPAHVVVMCGATTCLNSLGYTICDPGDVVITPTPVYPRIFTDLKEFSDVTVEPLVLSHEEDSDGVTFRLHPEALEERIQELQAEGRRVRAFVLLNPNNPLGDVYPPAVLTRLLHICARHQLHFISNEAYAFSVFDENVTFCSVLTLDLPDPERTHVIWSISKDLGLSGFRLGMILSMGKTMLACLQNAATYRNVPAIIQHAIATILVDTAWYDQFYPMYIKRLARNYKIAHQRLTALGATVRRGQAGLFIWFNMRVVLHCHSQQEERVVYKELLEAGLHILPGCQMYCNQPGWMRLVVSVPPQQLEEGLTRLETVVMARKKRLD